MKGILERLDVVARLVVHIRRERQDIELPWGGCRKLENIPTFCLEPSWQKKAISFLPISQATPNS